MLLGMCTGGKTCYQEYIILCICEEKQMLDFLSSFEGKTGESSNDKLIKSLRIKSPWLKLLCLRMSSLDDKDIVKDE